MFFQKVREGAPDSVFGMLGAFQADPRPEKISLMVGIYKNEALQSELLPVVKKVRGDFAADYLPFEGVPGLEELLGPLVFGPEYGTGYSDRIYMTQTVGGTSALRIGADFLAQEVGRKVYAPNPTWGNHRNIFERAGCTLELLPYYRRGLDIEAYLAALRALPASSIVLFHPTCHNPTGCDPTFEQWVEISSICQERKLFPFFDFAYQGLGDGMEEDAKVVRMFQERGHEMLVAYSCSKNFSLYCQRVGALFVVCPDIGTKLRVGSQIRRIIRAMYSNPPEHGGRIVAEILKQSDLRKQWLDQVEKMRMRIVRARDELVDHLEGFDHLRDRKGMFLVLDLTHAQVQALIEKHAIYSLEHGRISIAGLNEKNIPRVAKGIMDVCE
jgi:aromatic-amino-acid transaminase